MEATGSVEAKASRGETQCLQKCAEEGLGSMQLGQRIS